MESRLKTWTMEQWNIATWVLYQQICVTQGIKPDEKFTNFDVFMEKMDKGELSDLRRIAKQKVKEYETA